MSRCRVTAAAGMVAAWTRAEYAVFRVGGGAGKVAVLYCQGNWGGAALVLVGVSVFLGQKSCASPAVGVS